MIKATIVNPKASLTPNSAFDGVPDWTTHIKNPIKHSFTAKMFT